MKMTIIEWLVILLMCGEEIPMKLMTQWQCE